MRAFLKKLESPLLLAIRLYWGWQFATDGWGKLHHLDRVGQYFATLNLPMPHQTALFVSVVEFVGGILLAVGLRHAPDRAGAFRQYDRRLSGPRKSPPSSAFFRILTSFRAPTPITTGLPRC